MEKFKTICLSKKRGKAEIIALLIYIAGVILVMCFHEPWFDEAQAWQIARYASYKEILFDIPHYEGHPQLWHLILSIFAKNGAPYELSLKGVNLAFSAGAMAVLLFKSPFPKLIRCLLPFTYFLFYQHGVVSRPYSMMTFAIFLAAANYRNRNEHPWKYILSLCLLCLSSAYGVIVSGMLCLVWTVEIFMEMKKENKLASAFKDQRAYSLAFILVLAVFLAASLIPADDVVYLGKINKLIGQDKGVYFKIISLLVMPIESWCGILYTSKETEHLSGFFYFEAFLGIVMIITYFLIGKKNKSEFTVTLPLITVLLFMAFKYFTNHHLGVITIIFIFGFWIMSDKEEGLLIPDALKNIGNKFDSALLKKFSAVFACILAVSPLLYSVVASCNDITKMYSSARWADVIKEKGIEDAKIMVAWVQCEEEHYDKQDLNNKYLFKVFKMPSEHPKTLLHLTNLSTSATTILPYFDKNIFINYNVTCPDDCYTHHRFADDVEAEFALWRKNGLPDFIINYCPIDEVYDAKTLEGVEYLPVYELKTYNIFKLDADETTDRLYIRKDLLDDYPQFKWLYDPKDPVYDN